MAKQEISQEFIDFLNSEKIPIVMFKLLPNPLQKDIENKYFELKKQNESEQN